MLLAAMHAGVTGLLPLVQQIVIDDVIIGHTSPLVPWLVALVVMGLGIGLLSASYRYLSRHAALRVQHDLRNRIYDTLQRLDFSGHSQLQSGQLVSRASSDLRWVQVFAGFFAEIADTGLGIVVALIVMVQLSPLLALVVIVIIGIVFAITHRMRTKVHASGWDAQRS